MKCHIGDVRLIQLYNNPVYVELDEMSPLLSVVCSFEYVGGFFKKLFFIHHEMDFKLVFFFHSILFYNKNYFNKLLIVFWHFCLNDVGWSRNVEIEIMIFCNWYIRKNGSTCGFDQKYNIFLFFSAVLPFVECLKWKPCNWKSWFVPHVKSFLLWECNPSWPVVC